jgi:hypothetical protein
MLDEGIRLLATLTLLPMLSLGSRTLSLLGSRLGGPRPIGQRCRKGDGSHARPGMEIREPITVSPIGSGSTGVNGGGRRRRSEVRLEVHVI